MARDLTGHRYGNLTILSFYGKGQNTEQQWREFVASKRSKEVAA